jgi:hypothetical protein
MKTFTNYLNEGRDAPLYHTTGLDAAALTLSQNVLKPLTYHITSQIDKKKYKNEYGSSFTRSIEFAKYYGGKSQSNYYAIFEVDQAKIAQKNKIIAMNWYGSGALRYIAGQARNRYTESEEFVIGPIKNFDDVLIRIIVPNDDSYNYIMANIYFGHLARNPKLFYNGRFLNQ